MKALVPYRWDRYYNTKDRPYRNSDNSVPAVPSGINRENGSSSGALGFRETIFMQSYGKGMNTSKPE